MRSIRHTACVGGREAPGALTGDKERLEVANACLIQFECLDLLYSRTIKRILRRLSRLNRVWHSWTVALTASHATRPQAAGLGTHHGIIMTVQW